MNKVIDYLGFFEGGAREVLEEMGFNLYRQRVDLDRAIENVCQEAGVSACQWESYEMGRFGDDFSTSQLKDLSWVLSLDINDVVPAPHLSDEQRRSVECDMDSENPKMKGRAGEYADVEVGNYFMKRVLGELFGK